MRLNRQATTRRPTHARLLRRLSSRSSYDRAQAAQKIGALGDRTFLEPLERRLSDRSSEVRTAVVEALGQIAGPPSTRLLEGLTDTDELVRTEAIESISAKGYSAALPALKKVLKDLSPLVRSYAAGAIGRLGGPSEKHLLRMQLNRESSDAVKIGIVEGLWLLGDKSALDPALKLLASDDYRTRCATAHALSSTFLTRRTANRIQLALERRVSEESTRAPGEAITKALRVVVRQRRKWGQRPAPHKRQ